MFMNSDVREVFINPLEDLFCFAYSEFTSKPLDRIMMAFRVIASIYAMTSRQYIPGDSTRIIYPWIGNRNKVIAREYLPKATLLIAISTTIVPIFQAFQPILFGELIGKIELSHSTYSITLPHLFGVSCHPIAATLTVFFWIQMIVFICICAIFGSIFDLVQSSPLPILFWIRLSPFPICLRHFIGMVSFPFKFTFGSFFRMFHIPLTCAVASTYAANRINAIFALRVFRHFIVGFFETANAANSGFHDAFLSSYSMWMSAIAGIRRLSGATLADITNYSHKDGEIQVYA